MKSFADFLAAAKIEDAASREKYDTDARQPLDEALRLGSVAGPLVCTSCNGSIAEFSPVKGQPFEWGKVSPDSEVHAVTPNEIISAKNKFPTGTLTPEDAPTKLTRKEGFFVLTPDAVYVFPPKRFDSTSRLIDILKKCPSTATWPAGLPAALAPGHPRTESAEDRAFAACMEDANPVLAIKGPPGTGKTELLARVALGLAAKGKKVGIATVSHAAVNNALKRIAEKAKQQGSKVSIQKHSSKTESIPGVEVKKLQKDDLPNIWGAVTAAATWFYPGKDDNVSLKFKYGTCDVLLIDEAGQVPAYEAAALSKIATRMLLFGDEDQLPNICHGQHPPGSHGDSSAMRYLLDVLPGCSIPLEVSHRMNRDICGLIQRHFYPKIKLQPGKNADSHLIENDSRFPSLIKDNFTHRHPCLSRSEKEAIRVVKWVRLLLTMQAVLEGEPARAMTTADIAILTPFRAHAAAIKTALDKAGIPDRDKLRLGTVDKMQGQGAAAVIYSLASSSKDYIAAQTEWLLSSNRWNVAISRAMACAIVVGDLEAHIKALPQALASLASQTKIREVMEDKVWTCLAPN